MLPTATSRSIVYSENERDPESEQEIALVCLPNLILRLYAIAILDAELSYEPIH
jgi:hypothetical protein